MNYSQIRSIFIGGAVAHSAVFTRTIAGSVTAETAKAIKFTMQGDNRREYSVWLPKKAIIAKEGKHDTIYSLARWFRPDSYQWTAIERCEHIGGVSAA